MNMILGTVQGTTLSLKITGLLERKPVILQLLRFGAIGLFNTTIDVLVLNFMAAQFEITRGSGLGWVNIPGFFLAVVQSYFWNKYWAFENESAVNLLKNFFRLASVGIVGAVVYVLVVLGAHESARAVYFSGIFIVFILAQIALWNFFGFFKVKIFEEKPLYARFFIVSLIGFLINSGVLYLVSTYGNLTQNSGDNLNIAKLAATFFSLIWNFVCYKFIVFRR